MIAASPAPGGRYRRWRSATASTPISCSLAASAACRHPIDAKSVLESDALEREGQRVRSCLTQRNIIGPLAADSPAADGSDAFLGSVENLKTQRL